MFDISLAQCLALYLGDLGKFSMGCFVVFQASTGKRLWEYNYGNDIKHSAIDVSKYD